MIITDSLMKTRTKRELSTATKKHDLIQFVAVQFNELMKKNLKVPIKLYQL